MLLEQAAYWHSLATCGFQSLIDRSLCPCQIFVLSPHLSGGVLTHQSCFTLEHQLVWALSNHRSILLETLLGLNMEFSNSIIICSIEICDFREKWARILCQWMKVDTVNNPNSNLGELEHDIALPRPGQLTYTSQAPIKQNPKNLAFSIPFRVIKLSILVATTCLKSTRASCSYFVATR